jgi:hypothetical protein
MERRFKHALATAALATAFAGTSPVFAQNGTGGRGENVPLEPGTTVLVTPVRPGARTETTYVTVQPNYGMISTGLFMFGVPYVGSVVVASGSPVDADDWLYVPVAGPWIDLAERGPCGRGEGRPSCGYVARDAALLVADGIAQGVGMLMILGGYAMPVKRIVRVSEREIHIAPAVGGGTYGLAAAGRF